MCLVCALLCPRCERQVDDLHIFYQCLLKIQGAPDCPVWRATRFITSVESQWTRKFCDNIHCDMNVARQLDTQSQLWHVVNIMDAQQIAEHKAQPTTDWHGRATLLKTQGDSISIPPVADGRNSVQVPFGPRAPAANTQANAFLHRALSNRRGLMKDIPRLQSLGRPAKAFSWHDQMSKAIASVGRGGYLLDLANITQKFDNSKQAALEEDEYKWLCLFDDTSTVTESSQPQAGCAHQSGSQAPPTPGSETGPGPAPKHEKQASTRFPSAHASGPTSDAALYGVLIPQGGSLPATYTPARSSSEVTGITTQGHLVSRNVPPFSPYGVLARPRIPTENLFRSSSAIAGTGHDSKGMMHESNGFISNPTFNFSGQQAPLPGYPPSSKRLRWYSIPSRRDPAQPPPSTIFTVPNQYGFDRSTPPNHPGPHFQNGQMDTTQPTFQGNAGRFYSAAGIPPAGMSGTHAQALFGVGGSTSQSGVQDRPQGGHTSATPATSGAVTTQTPDDVGNSPADDFSSFLIDEHNPFLKLNGS